MAPALFRTIEILLPERDVLALFLWNIFWTTAIALAALWAVSCLSMKPLSATSLASAGFLLLVSAPSLLAGLHRWVRTGSFSLFFLQLPFYRSFYPQVAIPFLLGYVGLQVKAFRDGNRLWWVLLAGTQIATFVLFPYAALLMLCASLISIALQPLLQSKRIDWRAATVSLGASILGDVIAVILRSPRHLPGAGNKLPLALEMALPDRIFIAMSAVVLGAAVATFFLERKSEGGGDPTATSLGLAFVAVTWTGDLFIEHGLNVSLHVGYLNHVVLGVLFARCVSLLDRSFPSRRFQGAVAFVAALFLLHGVIASAVAGIGNLGESRAQRDLLQLVHEASVSENDLVVTPSHSRTPEGEWIPLVTHSRILFHPDAQAFMSRIDEKPYWFRLALYLHLTGRDAATVDRDFSQAKIAAAYVGPRDVTELSGRRRWEIIEETKQSLYSQMRGIESNPAAVCGFFQQFARVVLIEHSGDPLFNRQRLAQCLDLESSRHLGSWSVTVARRRLH